jgi:hypothetical protein
MGVQFESQGSRVLGRDKIVVASNNLGAIMLHVWLNSIAGFVCAGIVASLLGLVEPMWFGKGVIAFVYPLIVFVTGMFGCVFVLRAHLQHLRNQNLTFLVLFAMVSGLLGYVLTHWTTLIVPDFMKASGLYNVSGPLGVVGMEIVVIAVTMTLIGFLVLFGTTK